jgi:hypothetical protein
MNQLQFRLFESVTAPRQPGAAAGGLPNCRLDQSSISVADLQPKRSQRRDRQPVP